ncbi:MAG: YciI family protein [Bacteroidia bacterium]
MKEFMLFIRNKPDSKNSFSDTRHKEFLNACKTYIEKLQKGKQLISAQPLVREGKMISGPASGWKETSFQEGNDVMVGYYHILAHNLDEAIELAKGNPEFSFTDTARIEVRPVKMKEETTGYVYPDKQNNT